MDSMENAGILDEHFKIEDLKGSMQGVRESIATAPDLENVFGLESVISGLSGAIYKPMINPTVFSEGLLSDPRNMSKIIHIMGPEGSGKRTVVTAFAKALGAQLFCLSGAVCMQDELSKIVSLCVGEGKPDISIVYFDHCHQNMEEYKDFPGGASLSKELVYLIEHADILKANIWWIIGSPHYHTSLFGKLSSMIGNSESLFANPPNFHSRYHFAKRIFEAHFSENGTQFYDTKDSEQIFSWIAAHSFGCTFKDIYDFCVRTFRTRIANISITDLKKVTKEDSKLRPTMHELQICAYNLVNEIRIAPYSIVTGANGRHNSLSLYQHGIDIFRIRKSHTDSMEGKTQHVQEYQLPLCLGKKRTTIQSVQQPSQKRAKIDHQNLKQGMSNAMLCSAEYNAAMMHQETHPIVYE
jgi:hypothetical protein